MAEDVLTALDRCDRCGSQAYYRITYLKSGYDLLFCSHHGKLYLSQMQTDSIVVRDETSKLITLTK